MLVLRVVSGEKGIRGGIRRKMGVVRVERRTFRTGAWDEVTVFCGADRIRWRKIRRAMGRRTVCAVMAQQVQPPTGCGVSAYSSRAFAERLLLRTFVHAVAVARPACVGVADAQGEFCAVAEELLMYAGQVRVWTQCAARYAALAKRAVTEYGTAPVVSEKASVLEGVSALYLPPGCQIPPDFCCNAVFSTEQGYGVSAAGLILPQDLQTQLPPELSPLDFAAAAVEGGLIAQGEVRCRALARNGGAQSVQGLVRQLRGGG